MGKVRRYGSCTWRSVLRTFLIIWIVKNFSNYMYCEDKIEGPICDPLMYEVEDHLACDMEDLETIHEEAHIVFNSFELWSHLHPIMLSMCWIMRTTPMRILMFYMILSYLMFFMILSCLLFVMWRILMLPVCINIIRLFQDRVLKTLP